jgi:hypothetical protein
MSTTTATGGSQVIQGTDGPVITHTGDGSTGISGGPMSSDPTTVSSGTGPAVISHGGPSTVAGGSITNQSVGKGALTNTQVSGTGNAAATSGSATDSSQHIGSIDSSQHIDQHAGIDVHNSPLYAEHDSPSHDPGLHQPMHESGTEVDPHMGM